MKNDSLSLRKYKFEDAKTIAKWITNEKEHYLWSGGRFPYPVNADDFNAVYYSLSCMYSEENFIPLTFYSNENMVGHMVIIVTEKQLEGQFCFVIVNNNMRKQGIGKNMLHMAMKYASEQLGIQKITLGVHKQNVIAQKCYTAVGFRKMQMELKQVEKYEIDL